MSEKTIIFRLTEGRTPASWSLKGGMAVKEYEGLKYIGYYKGSASIFVDDNTDDRPQEEVVFEYNDVLSDPATQIEVPVSNKNLIEYLKAHAYFNLQYKIHNLDALAEEKLESFDKTERALAFIREEDDVKIQAMALAIFKSAAHGWSVVKCKAELKEAAIKKPDTIINAIDDVNYESNYLAGLAFFSGILTENNLHTAVVWNDGTNGEVIKLALGENGIQKLGDLLAVQTEESRILLQEIGNRIAKKTNVKNSAVTATTPNKTEEEIRAEERAKVLAEIAAEKTFVPETSATVVDEKAVKPDLSPESIEELQAQYKVKFETEVPPRYKNDALWIKTKLSAESK